MGRPIEKLSAVTVAKRSAPGRVSDGGGLYLKVNSADSKSWMFIWTKDGKRREMGLGSYPAITLKAAREKAAECRTLVEEGADPIDERNQKQIKTFGECADLYIESMEDSWRNEKHKYQWRQTLTNYCESIREKPVAAISTHQVLEVLTPIWTTKSETASRLRGRIELVLDYAKAKGWREGENPARWRGHLRNVLPMRKRLVNGHLLAMPYDEVPAFVSRLRGLESMSARALEFTILTAGRTSEVLKATWSEFDLDEALWVIPKSRMKGGAQHAVPLSKAAMNILRPLYENRQSDYVFPGYKPIKAKSKRQLSLGPLSSMAMEMLLRRLKVTNATVHGFRSSFRDWCGDETEFPREIAEAALAHKVGNEVERAYRRNQAIEKRRKLMDAWASFLASQTQPNIILLRKNDL
jgi:integrase